MTNIINHCRGEKRGIRSLDRFRRQLMPDHQIFESIKHKVKVKNRDNICKQRYT